MSNSDRPFIGSLDNMNEDQIIRKYVLDRILECRTISTEAFSDQDKAYIKLLDYCLVDKEKIRKMYYYISQYKLSQVFRTNKIAKEDFNPLLIDITEEEYLTFLKNTNF